MAKKPGRDVSPHPKGGWDVTKPGARRVSAHTTTQREAERRAKGIVSKEGGGEVRIRGRDGRIRDSDTVPPARDPNPSDGQAPLGVHMATPEALEEHRRYLVQAHQETQRDFNKWTWQIVRAQPDRDLEDSPPVVPHKVPTKAARTGVASTRAGIGRPHECEV